MTRASRSLDTEEPITLQRWVAFMRALKPLRTLGLSAAADALATGEIPAEVAVMAFDKGAAIASIQERSVSQGLENFDVLAHERTIDRFTTSTSAIRGELPRWIPAEIIAKRRFDVEYTGGRLGKLKCLVSASGHQARPHGTRRVSWLGSRAPDRKSTRLNSSHT